MRLLSTHRLFNCVVAVVVVVVLVLTASEKSDAFELSSERAIDILKNIPIVGPMSSTFAGLSLFGLSLGRQNDDHRHVVDKCLDLNPSDLNPLHSLGQLRRHLHAAALNTSAGIWIGRKSAIDYILPHAFASLTARASQRYYYALKIDARVYRCSQVADQANGLDDTNAYTWYTTNSLIEWTLRVADGRTVDELDAFARSYGPYNNTFVAEMLAFATGHALPECKRRVEKALGYTIYSS